MSDSDKPSSLQSLSEVDNHEIKKYRKPEEMKNERKRDRDNFRSERNDKFKYRGRGSRFKDNDSPRDSDRRWQDRRDKRMEERKFDNNARVKDENGANFSTDDVKDGRNRPNYESRGNRNKEKDERFIDNKKETNVNETDDGPHGSEKQIDKSAERTRNSQKGFGRPKRKDECENKETDEGNQNENKVKESRETDSEKHIKDEDKVIDRGGNDRKFQGNRGGFGRPPKRGDNNEDGEKSRRNNQNQRRGGFGRPPREDLKDENEFKEKPKQNRGGFGRPNRYPKENSEETSSGKRNMEDIDSDKSSHRNFDDQCDNGSRPDTGGRGRGRYNDRDRGRGRYNDKDRGRDRYNDSDRGRDKYNDRDRESWNSHGRSNKSDESVKNSDEDRSYSQSNDRRNQGQDKSRHYDRGGRRSGRGRGNRAYYQSRNQYENESNKTKSYSRNKSPRGSQQADKDTESVNMKLDKMVLSDNQLDRNDNCRIESSSKGCDKKEIGHENSKCSPTSKAEEKGSKRDCLTGPPGFVTECPPGFERTEGKGKSIVKPPPEFSS